MKNYTKRGLFRYVSTACIKQSSLCALLGTLTIVTLASSASAASLGDIFYIDMENHNLTQPSSDTKAPTQLLGNPAAPFQNSLITPGNPNAAQVSYASAYHNVLATPSGNNPSIHPSEPNYIWQEAGSNFGVNNDNTPFQNPGGTNQDQINLSGLFPGSLTRKTLT